LSFLPDHWKLNIEMESEKFCLRWNDFETNISNAFRELREEKDFFDVTLACDDSQIKAHKVILSACSPFFRNVLRRNPHQHPLLYLKGVKYKELLSVLNFMYMGEVNVAQEELNSFLSVAEDLKVKGLTQGNQGESKLNVGSDTEPTKQEHFLKESREKVNIPPPKRPRPYPATQRQQTFQRQDDIEEVIPVKSEPHEPTPQLPAQAQSHVPYDTQEQLMPDVQNQNIPFDQDPGTIALDDSYAVDEAYEYQYEEGYEDGIETAAGTDANTDVDTAIQSKMSKNDAGEWQCNDCFKTSRVKTNILEHIEATHVESPGYNCEICYKFYKNRHSLRNHRNSKHKDIKYKQLQGH